MRISAGEKSFQLTQNSKNGKKGKQDGAPYRRGWPGNLLKEVSCGCPTCFGRGVCAKR